MSEWMEEQQWVFIGGLSCAGVRWTGVMLECAFVSITTCLSVWGGETRGGPVREGSVCLCVKANPKRSPLVCQRCGRRRCAAARSFFSFFSLAWLRWGVSTGVRAWVRVCVCLGMVLVPKTKQSPTSPKIKKSRTCYLQACTQNHSSRLILETPPCFWLLSDEQKDFSLSALPHEVLFFITSLNDGEISSIQQITVMLVYISWQTQVYLITPR